MTDTHTTAHIPDEAIHAALLSMAQDNIGADVQGLLMHGFDKLNAKPNALRNALTAALPHLSVPCSVEVKKLEWKQGAQLDGRKQWHSNDKEFISETHPSWIEQGYRLFFAGTTYPTLEEAKAAVQADFERRILSCVVTKPVDVATVREALEWYSENTEGCRKITREGDKFRNALDADGGRRAREAIRALSAEPAQHPDETAVDNFARLMKAKLARKREEGRGGWQDMNAADLTAILRQHVDKGDPVDVANLCMMLSENGQCIAPAEPAQGDQWQDISTAEERAFDVILQAPDPTRAKGYKEVIGHWAQDLSGEEQPPFRGWFTDVGFGFREVYPAPTHWRRLPPAAPTTEAGK